MSERGITERFIREICVTERERERERERGIRSMTV